MDSKPNSSARRRARALDPSSILTCSQRSSNLTTCSFSLSVAATKASPNSNSSFIACHLLIMATCMTSGLRLRAANCVVAGRKDIPLPSRYSKASILPFLAAFKTGPSFLRVLYHLSVGSAPSSSTRCFRTLGLDYGSLAKPYGYPWALWALWVLGFGSNHPTLF
ncbi:hypothetical protein F4803DRAFT_510702 [Xylaria telfairii]|nr:hypothetical protein F4803DRAFT_510702 [Xylaria telfairii]